MDIFQQTDSIRKTVQLKMLSHFETASYSNYLYLTVIVYQ